MVALAARGINAKRLNANGAGGGLPIAAKLTTTGGSRNRRGEVDCRWRSRTGIPKNLDLKHVHAVIVENSPRLGYLAA